MQSIIENGGLSDYVEVMFNQSIETDNPLNHFK